MGLLSVWTLSWGLLCSFDTAYELREPGVWRIGSVRIFAHNFAHDMAEFMRLTHAKFTENGRRFRGCVGSYSSAVESILSEALYQAKAPFPDLRGRLEVSVTRFAPWPVHVVVGSFQDKRSIGGYCTSFVLSSSSIREPQDRFLWRRSDVIGVLTHAW